MDPKQESHLFLYVPATENTREMMPRAVYIKVPGLGSILCKVEQMSEEEIERMHKAQ